MAIAVFAPAVLFLFIWGRAPYDLFWLLAIANESHRYHEVLMALIPLTIFGCAVGFVFSGEFDRRQSELDRFYRKYFQVPTLVLFILTCFIFGYAFAYNDREITGFNFYFLSGIVVLAVAVLFVTDGFMAIARAEERARLRLQLSQAMARRTRVRQPRTTPPEDTQ